MGKVVAIIVAGGTGARMGTDVPKQFLELAGRPIIAHTIEKFDNSSIVNEIVIVCHQDHLERLTDIMDTLSITKPSKAVPGGSTRQESSFIGLKNCPEDTEYVLIHDAVRPFVTERIIEEAVIAAKKTGAAIPAIGIKDTVVEEKDNIAMGIADRSGLKKVQTPQAFHYDLITKVHEKALENNIKDATDDCGLVISFGGKVKITEGEESNLKITTKKDMLLAECLLKAEE